VPLLSVVVLWLPGQQHEAGSMWLAIGWLHEAGDPPHPTLRGGSMALASRWFHEAGDPPHPTLPGGSMALAIRWFHDGGETAGTWLHEAGDWQACNGESAPQGGS
jgi:hypothetical protein